MKMIFVILGLSLLAQASFAQLSCVTEESHRELESAYRVRHNPLINYFLLAGQKEFQRNNASQVERDEIFRALGNLKSFDIKKDPTDSTSEVIVYTLNFQNGILQGVVQGRGVQFGQSVDCEIHRATGRFSLNSKRLGLIEGQF